MAFVRTLLLNHRYTSAGMRAGMQATVDGCRADGF
jgi:hypothetical protein